jgi:hypothetical protein
LRRAEDAGKISGSLSLVGDSGGLLAHAVM